MVATANSYGVGDHLIQAELVARPLGDFVNGAHLVPSITKELRLPAFERCRTNRLHGRDRANELPYFGSPLSGEERSCGRHI
jgi:hypothetical protein